MTRKDFMVVAALAVFIVALSARVLLAPGQIFFNHGDLVTYHWPLRHHTAAAFIEGRLPFWNPYILLGVPHAANPQAVLFYPPALLGVFFPIMKALAWDQAFHVFWAFLGGYMLIRRESLSRSAATSMAIAYALSPFLIYRITAGIPTLLAAMSWVPWAWLVWMSGSGVLLSAVWALQFLSGHPQFLLMNAVAMALWAVARPQSRAALIGLVRGALGAMVLAAAQWLPTLEFLQGSNRTHWPIEAFRAYSLQPSALLSWVWPGALGTPLDGSWRGAVSVFYESCGVWFGGAMLALAFMGLLWGRARRAGILLCVGGLVAALGTNGPLAGILAYPGMSYLRTPSRWAFVTLMGLWLLAGQALKYFSDRPKRSNWIMVLPLLVILELTHWDLQFLKPQDARPLISGNASVSALLANRPMRVITDQEFANPNKAIVYRMRNINGYEAFYPNTTARWAVAAEGLVDSSRIIIPAWKNQVAAMAGVAAYLSIAGIEFSPQAWPLAAFLDDRGRRISPDPQLIIDRPERWRVLGERPQGARAIAVNELRWPGWQAVLDGKSVPLSPWGEVFSFVALGENRQIDLRFTFTPTHWFLWAAVSAIAWVLWFVAVMRNGALP